MPPYTFPFLSPANDGQSLGMIAHFRVIGLIDEGGMGYVFDAVDEKLQRHVALKVMKPNVALGTGSAERFVQEGKALAAVRHPNIATIYDIEMASGVSYLSMERLEGESLETRLRGTPVDIETLLRVGIGIARGLDAVHRANIIHRDIKPDNIWLEEGSGNPKLLDFGLARADSLSGSQGIREKLAGTPQYMSPEQVRGEPLTLRSDLYSLGAVLYRCLAGRPPFVEKDINHQLVAIVVKRPMPLADVTKNLPETLTVLVDRMLATQPAGRPASAREVEQQLTAVLNELTALALARQGLTFWFHKTFRGAFTYHRLALLAATFTPVFVVWACRDIVWRVTPTMIAQVADAETGSSQEIRAAALLQAPIREEVQLVADGVEHQAFGLRNREFNPNVEQGIVLVLRQGGAAELRTSLLLQFDLSKTQWAQTASVDAALRLGIVVRKWPASQRQLQWFGHVQDDAGEEHEATFADLQQWRESGSAVHLGNWDYAVEASQKEMDIRHRVFSSLELIKFLRGNQNKRVHLWLEQTEKMSGQLSFVGQHPQSEWCPTLFLTKIKTDDRLQD